MKRPKALLMLSMEGRQALIPLQRLAARSEFIPVNAEEDRLLRTSIPSRSSKKSADEPLQRHPAAGGDEMDRHSDYQAMKPYIAIAEKTKANAMKLFEQEMEK